VFARQATEEDVELILDIFNSRQKVVAPESGTEGEIWARDFIQGYPDPSPAWLLSESEDSEPVAAGNLYPNSNAKRFQAEISVRPGLSRVEEVVSYFLTMAREQSPDYAFWTNCNQNDHEFNQALSSLGLKVNRYFNSLRRELGDELEPQLPENVSTRLLDIASDEDVKIWHDLRVDAFSKHFGFKARAFEEFLAIMRKDPMMQIAQVHLLFEGDKAAGYIWLSDEASHEQIGYVTQLGVAYDFQGRGYGKYLLSKAISIYAQLGFKHIDLGVDTKNETGALKLYENLGFKVITTWVQYEA
jgi:mycothiol synthase